VAILTTATRQRMPKSQFALPGARFPINDLTHARMAISGATRSANVGNITPMQEATIKVKARRRLAKGI
jgi:hypothetical protein